MPLPSLTPALQQHLSLPRSSDNQHHQQDSLSSKAQIDATNSIIPNFVALYRYLVAEVVDVGDGSSRSRNSYYDNQGVRIELEEWWTELRREALLIRALGEACAGVDANVGADDGTANKSAKDSQIGGSVDLRLRELGALVAEYLAYGTVVGEDEEASGHIAGYGQDELDDLMADELAAFRECIDIVSHKVGHYIIDLEKLLGEFIALLPMDDHESEDKITTTTSKIPGVLRALSTTASTTANTSGSVRRHQQRHATTSTTHKGTASDLLKTHLQAYTKNLTIVIPTLLSEISTKLHTLLGRQAALLKTQIKHLETFTHSTQSRYLTTHATFLSTVSKGIALKAQLMSLLSEKEIYAEAGIREALRDTYNDLLREHEDLSKRERQLEILFGEYSRDDDGGPKSRPRPRSRSRSDFQDDHATDSTSQSSSRIDPATTTDKSVTASSRSQQENTFRTLGIEYARVEVEIEDVRRDIERLRRG